MRLTSNQIFTNSIVHLYTYTDIVLYTSYIGISYIYIRVL